MALIPGKAKMSWRCGSVVAALVLWAPLQLVAGAQYQVSAPNLTILLDEQGRIVKAMIGPQKLQRALTGTIFLEGCSAKGPGVPLRRKSGALEFSSTLRCSHQRNGTMLQRFSPGDGSVRWETEITFDGPRWTTPITTVLNWPSRPKPGSGRLGCAVRTSGKIPSQRAHSPEPRGTMGPISAKGISIPLASVLETGPTPD